jgi:hypothetical protein
MLGINHRVILDRKIPKKENSLHSNEHNRYIKGPRKSRKPCRKPCGQKIYNPAVENHRKTQGDRGLPRDLKPRPPELHNYPCGYNSFLDPQFSGPVVKIRDIQQRCLPPFGHDRFAAIKKKNARNVLRIKLVYSLKKSMFFDIMQLDSFVYYMCCYFQITYEEYFELYKLIYKENCKENKILFISDR